MALKPLLPPCRIPPGKTQREACAPGTAGFTTELVTDAELPPAVQLDAMVHSLEVEERELAAGRDPDDANRERIKAQRRVLDAAKAQRRAALAANDQPRPTAREDQSMCTEQDKTKRRADKAPRELSYSEIDRRNQYRNDHGYNTVGGDALTRQMRQAAIDEAFRIADKPNRKLEKKARKDAAARLDAAAAAIAAQPAPAFTARADAYGLATEQEAARRLAAYSTQQWNRPPNAAQLRADGAGSTVQPAAPYDAPAPAPYAPANLPSEAQAKAALAERSATAYRREHSSADAYRRGSS